MKPQKPLIVDATVRDGRIVIVDEFGYRVRQRKAAERWGDGALLKIRIEEAEDAATWAHHKHLHGHLLVPASEKTGYTVGELKAEMKARFLPEDWMTSTTDMNAEQFSEFNRQVAQCIAEEYPTEAWEACQAAMALSDHNRRTA